MAGSVRYESRWPQAILQIKEGTQRAVTAIGHGVQTQIDTNIINRGLIDTGNYRRSWTTAIEGEGMRAVVGSPVEYGVYLEYGYQQTAGVTFPITERGGRVIGWARTTGKRIAARPHVVPAAMDVAERADAYIKQVFR